MTARFIYYPFLHWHPHQRDVPVVADLAVGAPVLPHDVGVTEGLPLELAGHSPGPEVRHVRNLPPTPLSLSLSQTWNMSRSCPGDKSS